VVWTILYLPFGALGGFVSVALTFLATQHGLSISEGALLSGAQMVSQWLKWLWAPIVDVTLGPRRWYVISTAASALGVLAMASVPLGPDTLGLLLAVIAVASLVNTMVGMAVEAIIASCATADQVGRVGAWFQAGNLGGTGLGGALGLFLVIHLPSAWMAGAVLGVLFMLCSLALFFTPPVGRRSEQGALAGVRGVWGDLRALLKTKGGLLSGLLCVLPIGTGAAQAVLTQAEVAARWGAGPEEVGLVQGVVTGLVTAVGCFAGGYLCQRIRPRRAYLLIGVVMALTVAVFAVCPATITTYVVGNLGYAFVIGLAYAAFTAVVLEAMGRGSGATKYNIFASLSNFPIWWLGLVLGLAAQELNAQRMLFVEAGFGVLGVLVFLAVARRIARSKLADSLAEPHVETVRTAS